ncbi:MULTISPECIES: gluconate 2-dehydrogenase subunit 3 family protein [unclassified Haladaptatus]|uniref:gluconate 2-dehydrogenase subunit 3 family protein n=1 Tax=unclassified Haladaptatus TaxID=2622732 RepID=UPI00209C1909|nr:MULTISPECIES: gluconate 2-dehydrogenase subunit 3 family protein [unclassified Haladaptatus]MCO8242764.1 gluconate 2-dehydrogenase subunit 3 family protein [Haladaptatus sp. AB643]MCO8252523.1 gluconate 2-dehydrogenase subunit 3 family protein [Haladaptatus sp. AB618]
MELTRRDVLAALGAVGVAGGAAVFVDSESKSGTPPLSDHEVATLVAVAEVAYPSTISGVESFVRKYSVARANDDSDYRAGIQGALGALDDATSDWFDGKFVTLDEDTRSTALRQVGAVAGEPNPDGLRGERIRYYVLNELLFALYTTPTGSKLVGLENPPGYPGGDTSYQRGSQS